MAAPPAAAAPAAQITPPELLAAPSIAYPVSELASGVTGRVVLKVTVTRDGQANDPVVVESLGAAFDEAVLSRLAEFEFAPARRGPEPIVARVVLPIEFAPPARESSSGQSSEDTTAGVVRVAPPLAGTTTGPTQPPGESEQQAREPVEELEVEAQGHLGAKARLEKSADAVTVVRLDEEKRRSSDMADVLSRTPGVIVRRSGGLGSDVRFSINGLYDSAVRLFVDGVPFEMSGLPRNAGMISINLVDHVEVYRGVVPLRLAADALGGAMNFVTDKSYRPKASVSFMEGSFGTYRGTALVQYRHDSGFVFRATGYADRSRNDYLADVKVPDDKGRLSPARVPLSNNEVRAAGGSVEVGVVEKKWADRLILKGFYSDSSREYGHNLVMTVPYGEVRDADRSGGGHLFYEVRPTANTRLEHITNLSHRAVDFLDVSEWVYDWYGERVRERRIPGEVEAKPHDLTIWDNSIFSRTMFEWNASDTQTLLFNVTPKFTTRTGDERRQLDPDARDPLSARNDVMTVVSGVGHEWSLWKMPDLRPNQAPRRGLDYRISNTFNVKSYIYALGAEEPLPGGGFRNQSRVLPQFGVADAVRFAIDREWSIKTSYEYATRLPDSWEVFGDGVFVQPNLELNPEVSHNFNLGPIYDAKHTATGDWVAFVNGGFRDSDNMIVLLGNDRYYTYQNVYRAVTLFGEGGTSWVSPGRYLALDAKFTANDSRNRSSEGTFADFEGDRIPNRPPLTASWAARLSFSQLFMQRDRLEPFYQGSFSSGFYRGWESQGLQAYKQRIEDQSWHDLGITYVVETDHTRISNTIEVQNFTDEVLYELYGRQRPGRAVYWKFVADFY